MSTKQVDSSIPCMVAWRFETKKKIVAIALGHQDVSPTPLAVEVNEPDPVLILEFPDGTQREFRGDELECGLELARQCPAFR